MKAAQSSEVNCEPWSVRISTRCFGLRPILAIDLGCIANHIGRTPLSGGVSYSTRRKFARLGVGRRTASTDVIPIVTKPQISFSTSSGGNDNSDEI